MTTTGAPLDQSALRARLLAPEGIDAAEVTSLAQAAALARDLINVPANDMGPVELEMAAREVAEAFGAKAAVVVGDALLDAGYPAVHAVGRAAVPARAHSSAGASAASPSSAAISPT